MLLILILFSVLERCRTCTITNAFGAVVRGLLMSDDPETKLGGSSLRGGWSQVLLKKLTSPLLRPYGQIKTIRDAT